MKCRKQNNLVKKDLKQKKQFAYRYGIEAEAIAVEFLVRLGFEILETRYKVFCGEIDIVAKDGEYLVFLEVKARNKIDSMEFISCAKRKKICRAANYYLMENNLDQYTPIRFDYIIIQGSIVLEHVTNAWEYVE